METTDEGFMRPKQDLTADEVRRLFNYDPETGVMSWKEPAGRYGRIKAGTPVGTRCTTGHLQVRTGGRLMVVHRLAFTHVYGRPPADLIDHINGDPSDNRIANLREASKALNTQNIKGPTAINTHGHLGVCKTGSASGWQARIHINNKQRYLGTFRTPEAAHEAYLAAKRQFHEGCTL